MTILKNRHYNANPALLGKMTKAGYRVDSKGVCAGATMSALGSLLDNGHTKTFDDSIHYIHSKKFTSQRIPPGRKLFRTKEEQQLLDAYGRLDQIQIYHRPEIYHEVFNRSVSLYEAQRIAPLVESNQSASSGGLTTRDNWSWSGTYTSEQLTTLLQTIKSKTVKDQTLAFNIGNTKHKIMLGLSNGKWHLTDIEHMPSYVFKNTRKLAHKIHSILKNKRSKKTTLSLTAYSHGNKAESTQSFFNALHDDTTFKQQHRITNATIAEQTQSTLELAQLAVLNHQTGLLNDLLSNGLNVNAITPSGYSLAYLAAEYGYADMLRTLISAGANINSKEGEHGLSPILIATEYRHQEAITVLIENGANMDQESNDHLTPIAAAANLGDVDTLKILKEHGVQLNQHTFFGTPLEIAEKAGHQAAVSFIKDQSQK